MLEINLNNKNFEEEVKEGMVLVDFFATWCAPCKMLAPVLSKIAEEYKDKVKVGKVNVDENQELAMEYGVMSIPTIVIIENGEVKNTLVAVRDKNEIKEMLK